MGRLIRFELIFMASAIIQGVKIAAAYDILRLFRVLIKHNNIVTGAEDFIFANAAGVFAFAMIYSCNDGIIRGFAICFIVLGICFYNVTAGRITIPLITKFLNTVFKVLKKAGKHVKIKSKRNEEGKE